MVERLYNVGNVLGHVNLHKPVLFCQLGAAVNQVGGQYAVDQTGLVSLVELVAAVGEQTERSASKYALGTSVLELGCYVKQRFARGDHVVHDQHVLAVQILTEVLVSLDGIFTVDYDGVVTALVEHTDVQTQHRGIVHASLHSTLVGRNDHHAVLIDYDIRHASDQRLDHLVGGSDVVKAVQRDRVTNSGVVCIEGDDVGNTHRAQLLQHQRAVQRFSCLSAVLSALIEHGHDDGDSSCLTRNSSNDALKVGVVVVGAHGNGHAVHLVGNAVIENVTDDVHVLSAHGLLDQRLSLARTESGASDVDKIRVVRTKSVPVLEIIVNLFCDFLASAHADHAELGKLMFLHHNF